MQCIFLFTVDTHNVNSSFKQLTHALALPVFCRKPKSIDASFVGSSVNVERLVLQSQVHHLCAKIKSFTFHLLQSTLLGKCASLM